MALTERQPSARARPTPTDDAFEEVRQSFLMRLPGEHARLLAFTDALGSGKGNPALTLGALEVFAHRLRGAAAVFDACALSADAKALELAVAAALIAPVRDNDTFVRATLRALISRLASMIGTELPADCAVQTAQ
jgi:hypothetical protein